MGGIVLYMYVAVRNTTYTPGEMNQQSFSRASGVCGG